MVCIIMAAKKYITYFILGLLGTISLFGWSLAKDQKMTLQNKFPKPVIIPHNQWEAFPSGGVAADASRRNIGQGEKFIFKGIELKVLEVILQDTLDSTPIEKVKICLSSRDKILEQVFREDEAFNWNGYHVAVVAIHGKKGELGEGLTEFEIADIDSLPVDLASSTKAGSIESRLRIPHKINKLTLHHSGDTKPVALGDDIPQKLRGLQSWGANDKNWWDVPYHFFIGPDGTIYEGRDYHYMGETNTRYNPAGHLLINVVGNYEIQEPNDAQLKSVMDLMAWAVQEFNVPVNEIYGHRDLAQTDCPGENLYRYLKNGKIKQGIKERLHLK